MEKKIYRLKKNFVYKGPADKKSESLSEFREYVNKKNLQITLAYRNKLMKKYRVRRMLKNPLIFILVLLASYYLLIALVILLSKFVG